MSFAALKAAGLAFMLSVEGEPVTYRSVRSDGVQVRKSFNAIVEQHCREEQLDVGISAPADQPVIVITVSKADLPRVNARRDEVTWRGTTFGVKEVRREDDQSWRLYCVA